MDIVKIQNTIQRELINRELSFTYKTFLSCIKKTTGKNRNLSQHRYNIHHQINLIVPV